ncbi:MAG TPA: hypothetical protein VN154_04280 [Rhizomicrobium sp.]|nr:hypothetical protein [Rhizomicrobium sp.]
MVKPLRVFAWADGEVLTNIGDQTLEEAKLGLPNLTGLSPAAAGDKIFSVAEERDAEEAALAASGLTRDEAQAKVRPHAFPNEDDVVELAALWSIDPTRLSGQDHAPGLGLVARLPQNMRQ